MARIVRADRELEMPRVDAALRAAGHELVLLRALEERRIAGAALDVFGSEPLARCLEWRRHRGAHP